MSLIRRRFIDLTIFILTIVISVSVFPVFFYAGNMETRSRIDEIIEWKMKQFGVSDEIELISALSENKQQNDVWYLLSLVKYHSGDDPNTDRFSSNVENNIGEIIKNDHLKLCFAMSVLGYTDIAKDLAFEINSDSNIMDLIFGLMIEYIDPEILSTDEDNLIALFKDRMIIKNEKEAGWALSGNIPDPDVTAMTLQAMSYYVKRVDVYDMVERGLCLLSSIQNESGGFSSWGNENPETSSQVVIALCCLGIDPSKDERFIKNGNSILDALDGFRYETGGYSHIKNGSVNDTSTYQVLMALISNELLSENKTIYDGGSKKETPQDHTDQTPGDDKDDDHVNIVSTKTIVVLATGIVCLTILVILIIRNKNDKKKIVISIIIALAIFGTVCFLDIKSPSEFISEGIPEPINEDSVTVTVAIEGPEGISLLSPTRYVLHQGESVKELLIRISRYIGKMTDFSGGYLRGFAGYYEFDYGATSGWTYYVNGIMPMDSMDAYYLDPDDELLLKYVTEFSY